MSLLAVLTVKVSVILLLALVGVVCLRTRSAAARHWVLAVGVVSACGAPAVHVLQTLPLMQVAPVGPLAWSVEPVFDALRLRPHTPFTEPTDARMARPVAGREPRGSRPGPSRPAVATAVTPSDGGS